MSQYTDEQDDVQFSEPILAQKQVKLQLNFAEKTQWEAKTDGVKDGRMFDACKLTLDIIDETVKTEHADAKPRLTIEDQFNIVSFPYQDKKTKEVKQLGRTKLYQLEEAFGFDPIFKVNGAVVEPFITKSGAKRAPKLEGVKRVLNPDFFNAYFGEDGTPKMENWQGKTIYADVEVETSTQYGDKNTIGRYVPAPLV